MSETACETQGTWRKGDLRRPSVLRSRGAEVPNSVPIERQSLRVGNQAIDSCVGGIDLKEITGAMIAYVSRR